MNLQAPALYHARLAATRPRLNSCNAQQQYQILSLLHKLKALPRLRDDHAADGIHACGRTKHQHAGAMFAGRVRTGKWEGPQCIAQLPSQFTPPLALKVNDRLL